jgi:hypothetical protein
MKKIKWPGVAIICVLLFSLPLHAAALSIIEHRSTDPVFQSWMDFKVRDFIKLSTKDYSNIIGRKLNLKEKISFKIMKLRMKHQLKKQPDLLVGDYLATEGKISTGWLIAIIIVVLILILLAVANPVVNIGPF